MVNFFEVFFSAEQIAGLSLQPAFDSVQVFTSVLVNGDDATKLTVPATSPVFAADSVTVVSEKLSTVAPAATPVPVTVIPRAMPLEFPTEMVFCPDNPVAEVTTAAFSPKTIVPDTAAEWGVESVIVVPDTPVTLAPLATPMP